MNTLSVLFILVSAQQGLPEGLLSSLCLVESRHDVNAVHQHDGHGNSVGACQIKLNTAKGLGFKGTEKDLLKPEVNLTYAAKYLKHQILRYNGDVTRGVIAYNQGSARTATKTQYSSKVFAEWSKTQQHRPQVACVPKESKMNKSQWYAIFVNLLLNGEKA